MGGGLYFYGSFRASAGSRRSDGAKYADVTPYSLSYKGSESIAPAFHSGISRLIYSR